MPIIESDNFIVKSSLNKLNEKPTLAMILKTLSN